MEDLLNWRPFIPMGAILDKDNMNDYIDNPDYIAEVKYDGYRMLGWFDKDRVRFTTRSIAIDTARAGNPMPTERTDNVPHLRDLDFGDLYGTIIDGEFWKPGCTSHNMTSLLGGLPETSIANQEAEGYVHYIIYDLIQFKGKDATEIRYEARRDAIERIVDLLKELNPDKARYIHTSEVVKHEDKVEKYKEIISDGGEGMILKHKDSLYYPGKIHKNKGVPSKIKASSRNGLKYSPWIKWKKYDTFDCVVMGFSNPSREYKGSEPLENWPYWDKGDPVTKFYHFGWPGAIIFGQYHEGKLIEVGQTSGISDEWRERFAKNPDDYIGKVIEVGCMERIKKTKALREPRFLRFRDDKNEWECIVE